MNSNALACCVSGGVGGGLQWRAHQFALSNVNGSPLPLE